MCINFFKHHPCREGGQKEANVEKYGKPIENMSMTLCKFLENGCCFFFFARTIIVFINDTCTYHPRQSPGFSVHGILQARTLEWTAIPFSSLYLVLDLIMVSILSFHFYVFKDKNTKLETETSLTSESSINHSELEWEVC